MYVFGGKKYEFNFIEKYFMNYEFNFIEKYFMNFE